MTPRSAATARADTPRVVSRATRPAPRVAPAPRPRATPHRVAAPAAQTSRARRRPKPVAIAAGVVIASLLAVVGGNMELAAGQLRLEQAQSRLADVQSSYAAALASVTAETSPQALARAAGHLVLPSAILPIYSVPLDRRLLAPRLSTAPCCSLTPGQ